MSWKDATTLSVGRLIRHAALRGPVCLHDGTEAKLIAVHHRKRQARIEFGDGRARTVRLDAVAWVDEFRPDASPGATR